jgi:hypothetical protein
MEPGEACNGNKSLGPISQPLYPWLWIFVGDRAGSRPGEDRMTGRKRIIQTDGLKEISFPRSLQRTLTPSNQLHRRVHQIAVSHCLGSEYASFDGMRIATRFSIYKQDPNRSRCPRTGPHRKGRCSHLCRFSIVPPKRACRSRSIRESQLAAHSPTSVLNDETEPCKYPPGHAARAWPIGRKTCYHLSRAIPRQAILANRKLHLSVQPLENSHSVKLTEHLATPKKTRGPPVRLHLI